MISMEMQTQKGAGRWTIRRLIQTTAGYLERKGSSSPRLDAELLLAKALRCERVQLYLNMDQPLLEPELAAYREYVRRRAAREPVAYILGEKEFYGLRLRVDPGVLIPRPDTETLVEAALGEISSDAAALVADIGVGSGAVVLALAAKRTNARFIGTDVSKAALALAGQNAQALGLGSRVEWREGPLLEPLRPGEVFDGIVSNPPYIPTAELERLQPEIRDYEPRGALDGGPDGLSCLLPLIAGAGKWIRKGGFWACEFGDGQSEAVFSLTEKAGAWERIEIRQDLAGLDRVLLARRK